MKKVEETIKLNKYEKTRILSARTLQISENAPIYVKQNGLTKSFDLAVKEYQEGKVPLKVVRRSMKEDADLINEEVK